MQTIGLIKRLSLCVLSVSILTVFVGGCSDSPQRKAAREAVEISEKAASVYSGVGDKDKLYSQARADMDKAVSLASKAGNGADAVYLASANMYSDYANYLSVRISADQNAAMSSYELAAQKLRTINSDLARKEACEKLLAASANELADLEKALKEQKTGLENKQVQLKKLMAERAEYDKKAQAAYNSANEIQQKVDQLLKKADVALGDEKLSYQRKALNLVQGLDEDGKKTGTGKIDYSKEQELYCTKSDGVQVNIDIVKPQVEDITAKIETIEARISECENSQETSKLSEQAAAVEAGIKELEKEVADNLAAAAKKVEAFTAECDRIEKLYNSAMQHYGKVRSRQSSSTAKLAQAAANMKQGGLFADKATYFDSLAAKAESVTQIADQAIADQVAPLSAEYTKSSAQASERAAAIYDDAIEAYDQLTASASGGGEYGSAAYRGYYWAIVKRLDIAEKLGQADIKDTLIGKIQDSSDQAMAVDNRIGSSDVGARIAALGILLESAQDKLVKKYKQLADSFDYAAGMAGDERVAELKKLVTELNGLEVPEDTKIRQNLIKSVFEAFGEDIKLVAEEDPSSDVAMVFGSMIAGGQEETVDEGFDTGVDNGGPSPDNIGGPDPNF